MMLGATIARALSPHAYTSFMGRPGLRGGARPNTVEERNGRIRAKRAAEANAARQKQADEDKNKGTPAPND